MSSSDSYLFSEQHDATASTSTTRETVMPTVKNHISPDEAAIFEGGAWDKKFFVRFSDDGFHWPIVGAKWIDMRPVANLACDDGCGVFAPPSLASQRGNLRLSETVYKFTDRPMATKDVGTVLVSVSIRFLVAKNRHYITAAMTTGVYSSFSHSFSAKVTEIVATEVAKLSSRHAIEHQGDERKSCPAALKKAIEEAPGGKSGGFGLKLVDFSMSIRAGAVEGPSAKAPGLDDLPNQVSRLHDLFKSASTPDDRALLERLAHALIDLKKISAIAQSDRAVFVLPADQLGLFKQKEEMLACIQTLSEELRARCESKGPLTLERAGEPKWIAANSDEVP